MIADLLELDLVCLGVEDVVDVQALAGEGWPSLRAITLQFSQSNKNFKDFKDFVSGLGTPTVGGTLTDLTGRSLVSG